MYVASCQTLLWEGIEYLVYEYVNVWITNLLSIIVEAVVGCIWKEGMNGV